MRTFNLKISGNVILIVLNAYKQIMVYQNFKESLYSMEF